MNIIKLNYKKILIDLKNINMLKTKIKILANFYFDRFMPYKRLRKFSIDRWLYKDESERYKKYNYTDKSINIYPEKDFYHPEWECLVPKKDTRYIYLKQFKMYDFFNVKEFPNKYKQAYSSNFIQKQPISIVEKILLESHNSLLRESIFRLVVPDSDLAYEAYQDKRVDFFEILSPKNYCFRNDEYYIEIMLATFMAGNDIYNVKKDWKLGFDIRNYFLKNSKDLFLDQLICLVNSSGAENKLINKNWFNYRKLKTILLQSGFLSVYKSGFGQSKSPQMRDVPLFDAKNPSMSLYVEARK
tara:strand:- start:5747 stop:6646 length:900 start_codon:yes stop_codon:yes gene_type:complete